MRTALMTAAWAILAGLSPAWAAEPATVQASLSAAAADLAPDLQTGSLLFSQGDCLAIRVYTASAYTHVALVVIDEGRPVVYDSTNGAGVRRLTLEEYLRAESSNCVRVFHPLRPLTAGQGSELAAYLQSQVGRPYAIHHHLTGQRTEGLHCAEYATDALMSIGIIRANRPSKVSPASLVTGITRAHLYEASETIDLQPPDPTSEPAKNRCHQLWLDTKQCTSACCAKLSGWFLCR